VVKYIITQYFDGQKHVTQYFDGQEHVTQSHRRSADFDAGTDELNKWYLITTLKSWDEWQRVNELIFVAWD
jgi:hypothetical protein